MERSGIFAPRTAEELTAMREALQGDLHVMLRSPDESRRRAAARRLWLHVQEHPAYLMLLQGWDCQSFHWDAFADVLLEPENLWLAPRGSGKSTAHAVFFPAWLAVADPDLMHPDIRALHGGRGLFPDSPRRIGPWNIRIALTSNSYEKAVALHWQVKAVLTSRTVQWLFGPLAGRRWKDETSQTTLRERGRDPRVAKEFGEPDYTELREGTFTALGLGSKVTGGHYDVVAVDDWVTEDNARTELQRQRIEDFWAFTVRGTLEPWARTVGCGTRYHPADWYAKIKEWSETTGPDGGKLWGHVRRTPALVSTDGGPCDYSKPETLRSYWPTVYTVEKLLQIREQIGAVAFATQYQNETDLMLGDFFAKEWLERFKKYEELSEADRALARTYVAVDPAVKGGKRNDYTAIVVVTVVAPYFYVREVVRGQWTEKEIEAHWNDVLRRYRPGLAGVEIISGFEWSIKRLRKIALRYMTQFRALRPQRYRGGDKEGRASHVRSLFESLRVYFEEPRKGNGIARLLEEMMAFPNASSQAGMDDCVDALVWCLLLAFQGRSRAVKLRNRSRSRI